MSQQIKKTNQDEKEHLAKPTEDTTRVHLRAKQTDAWAGAT